MFVILIAFVLTNENVELVNQFRLNLEKKREKSNQIKYMSNMSKYVHIKKRIGIGPIKGQIISKANFEVFI